MIINTNKQLSNLITALENTQKIAVDTEFYWMRTYYPELCLIQITTEKEVFLIDTLVDIDFSPLKKIFEDQNIEKIIHSATNDIPIIKRFFDCEVNNIFDTQLAATFIGFKTQLSLKSLLKEILDIDMEKESQFSDWRKRPLSEKQINYAIKDVEHLIEIRDHLSAKLDDSDYKNFYEQELLDIQRTEFNSVEIIHTKIGNIQKFEEEVQKNAIAIAQWREQVAQEKNIPVRFMFNNKILYLIAHAKPKSIDDFKHPEIKKLKPWLKKAIIDVLKSAHNVQDSLIEKKQISGKISSDINNKIIECFDIQTKDFGFDSSIIASRKDIKSLAYNLSIDSNYSKGKLLNGWRYKVVGKKLKEYILETIK
ncbi:MULTISPECIES: ribonuclease D [unclassified Francisella]|uniref:ribonuclease D n=1 Tax=unclassified Francisella TaxID=2610885 RepID=UPI002E37E876|nr:MULTISPECIES: HRDC domain-containing protein [unclassified Francisella]MED7819721.1 HRDC domain-containing protein [Francisella sp. 19S2-4]MED7830514.1 HRDC domain-containing protein [Francisella sp. 19S2-10]